MGGWYKGGSWDDFCPISPHDSFWGTRLILACGGENTGYNLTARGSAGDPGELGLWSVGGKVEGPRALLY